MDPAKAASSECHAVGRDDVPDAPVALLWLGFAVAFSPVLVDYFQHLAVSPWARYAALFPVLFAVAAAGEQGHRPRHRDGGLWIAAGLCLAVFAVFSGVVRYGRAGAVLAAVGLCRAYGLASWRALLLLPFCVPVPTAVAREAGPGLAAAALGAAGAALGALGLDLSLRPLEAATASAVLSLDRYDGGLSLAALCAGLTWYAGLRWGAPVGRTLLAMLGAAWLALPLQTLAIAIALVLLGAGSPAAARGFLTHVPWLVVAATGLLLVERRARRRRAHGVVS